MTPAVTLFLDNEAVQSLMDIGHAKHRRALALLAGLLDQAGTGRHRARDRAVARVPTAVRVEAGWDRRSTSSALVNSFAILDVPLDAGAADRAAAVVRRLGVSVADAHIAAAAHAAAGPCVVVTSDTTDMLRMAGAFGIDLRPVRL